MARKALLTTPPFGRILIANRGEIAIRIARAAADLGIATVAVAPKDDLASLHVRRADAVAELPGTGAAGYLDIAALIDAARATACDAVHPGYGFLSENADFARACAEAGIAFIGPRPETLELFGDKSAARRLAQSLGIPVARGTDRPTTLPEIQDFLAGLGPGGAVMIKAIAGGGGRGMRVVEKPEDLAEAFTRAGAEAQGAFGSDALYVEELIGAARHVEVQILGDRAGTVVHLHERECSLQRRHQKLVEIAPCHGLDPGLRRRILDTALILARAAKVETLCTIEFLVEGGGQAADRFVFMEANPRLQVEHTVTEEVTGIDLVRAQIETAAGRSLAALGLTQDSIPEPRGTAVQLRINLEKIDATGNATTTGGLIRSFHPPTGRGIRVETFAYAGYRTSARYDPLLAKLIVHVPENDLGKALAAAYRALCEFDIGGVETNIPFLQTLLRDDAVRAGDVTTRFIETHAARLAGAEASHPRRFVAIEAAADREDSVSDIVQPEGTEVVTAPITGLLVGYEVGVGDAVRPSTTVAVVEAMKMQHTIAAGIAGTVRLLGVAVGETVDAGTPLIFIEPGEIDPDAAADEETFDPQAIREDLREVLDMHAGLMDAARPEAVARRRKTGQRTARENIDDLVDPGSFIEYGALALAAQRRRRTMAELRRMSPADGLITGVGTINAPLFGDAAARAMVMSYDYTVFAGTQGFANHRKTDRMLHLAQGARLPLVIFAEGGGGRPGETDYMGVAGLDLTTFRVLASLSGEAPSVAIVSGRCFAGNAAVAGCCDLLVATANVSLGMGGPAMIEGGGLGRFLPEEVGPADVQTENGVIDVLVADEAEAVAVTKRYLGYFQGPLPAGPHADQTLLRHVVPPNRLRAYDIRKAIELLADTGSILELRPRYGLGIVTALARIDGQPVGLMANNPLHLGGAIDGDAADKAARFMELCEAYGLPIVSLCDTPGFMVGPAVEKTALVRRISRMFLGGATLSVPLLTVFLRKGYGLGAQAMAGGSTMAPRACIAWPTGEFGGMGLEGAVNLGYRAELEAIADPAARAARYAELVAELYQRGKALNMASFLEIDAVIDPAETRRWILRTLKTFPVAPVAGKRRPFVTPR
jgi:acetyl/propionyl-CoA carboxylase alpha subunit/acetyl-CoA carboxylase carboxyltransferase component